MFLQRWLKSLNVGTASTHRQRHVAKSWSGDNFQVEDARFMFPIKDTKGHY